MRDERIISPEILDSDEENISIRPKSFDEYIGQDRVKANMNVYVRAAKSAGTPWIMCSFTDRLAWERQP